MAIITAAGLTDLYNQRTFNKNGSTVTLKKISDTDWLLFGDLVEGDSEGFVTNSQLEFELPPFRPSEEFTQVYSEALVWHDLDYTIGGTLDQPLEYFTQASLDEYFPPPPRADGRVFSSMVSGDQTLRVDSLLGEGVLLKELPQGAERIRFGRAYCTNPLEVVVSKNLLDGKESLLYCEYSSDDIYMGWEFIGWISDPEWEDFNSFVGTKMFSVWDSEGEVWVNSLESGYFYSDDPNLVYRLSQNPSLFTKLRMIDWDWA